MLSDLGVLAKKRWIPLTQLKEEVRLSRDGATRYGTATRVPYLPSYSGDKGIDFKHYESAIESVSMSNNDAQVVQAIRKSVTGSAAQVIGSMDYTTSKAEIVKQLQDGRGFTLQHSQQKKV